jgi:hypothetical protein
MKQLFAIPFALFVTLATGCGSGAEPPDSQQPAVETPAPESNVEPKVIGPCPFEWTCNEQQFYPLLSTCQANCGTRPCHREEYNNGHCIPR